MPVLGVVASSFLKDPGPVGAFDALASVLVPSGGVTSIVFAGIPDGYSDLQLRGLVRGGAEVGVFATFNGISGNGHALYGNGTIVSSYRDTAGIAVGVTPTSGTSSSVYGSFVADILNYSAIGPNKTVRSLMAVEKDVAGGNPYVFLQSSLWQSTNAIETITLTLAGGATFAQNTRIALYGVK